MCVGRLLLITWPSFLEPADPLAPEVLKQDVEHEAVLVHRPPQPVSDAIDARTHLVQMPPGTPTGFPVAQSFCKQWTELDAPFAEGLVEE